MIEFGQLATMNACFSLRSTDRNFFFIACPYKGFLVVHIWMASFCRSTSLCSCVCC